MESKTLSMQLIEETLKAVDKVGTERTLDALKEVQLCTKEDKVKLNLIVSSCCDYYKISENTLKTGNERGTSPRKVAMTICFVLMENVLNYSQHDISQYFGKHKSLVCQYMGWFKKINPKTKVKYESDVLYDFIQIEKMVNEKLNSK